MNYQSLNKIKNIHKNKFARICLVILSLWALIMFMYKIMYKPSNFWSDILFNLIYGIPLSLATSLIASWFFSEFVADRKKRKATEFYSQFIGDYQELKVISLKDPKIEWREIKISLHDLDLLVEFKNRVYKPEDLYAKLIIPGNDERKSTFEVFYEQESVNGSDEGYWGKYDIQLLNTGEVIGHKYHTADGKGLDEKVQYISTRIKWVKINN